MAKAMEKAVQQEWRLKLLINLHKILLSVINNHDHQQV